MIGRWRRRGKPAERAQQRILRFVVIGYDVEIIAPGTRQVLFGLNRLENNADTEFFAFLPEANASSASESDCFAVAIWSASDWRRMWLAMTSFAIWSVTLLAVSVAPRRRACWA